MARPTRTSLKRSHRWPGVGLEPCLGANAPPVGIKQVVYESRTYGLKCLLGQTWLRNLGHCYMGTRGNASKLQNQGFQEWEAIFNIHPSKFMSIINIIHHHSSSFINIIHHHSLSFILNFLATFSCLITNSFPLFPPAFLSGHPVV